MRRLRVALALLLLAPVADAATPLTLAEVTRSVRTFSPAIAAAQAELAGVRGEWRVAEGAFDPSLRARVTGQPLSGYESVYADVLLDQPISPLGGNVFGGWRLGRGSYPVYDGKLVTNEFGEVRAGGSLSLLRNRETDRRRTNAERAAAATRGAEAAFDGQLLDLTRAAANRYWDWVAAGQRVVIAEGLLRVAIERDAWLGTRITTGEVPALDRIDNERAIEQRRQGLATARRSRDQAAIELSLFLRDEQGEPVVPDPARLPTLPDPVRVDTTNPDLDGALARRPEVRRLEAQRQAARAELAFAENQLSTGLDLTVAVSQDLGAATDGDQKRGKAVLESGLVLDVPLQQRLLGGRNAVAEAAVVRLEAQARLARDRVRADLQDAANALALAQERVEAARRELALAREVEAGERTRYTFGESSLVFVNLREQQTFETAVREVDALVDHHKAHAAWQVAGGRQLP